MNKKNQWIRFRHRVVRNIAFALLQPYTRLKYGITIEKINKKDHRQCLIIMNHQTAFDQFFVGMAFPGPVYYIASEDLFSNGWISRLISYLVAPIPIKKQATDLKAVKTCIRVAREGGTIALAPEGNRTYHGRSVYFKPSIVKLVRALKLPLAIFRIEGGYGVHPRWSDVVRKGKMRAYFSRVVEPEEYASLSDEELHQLILREMNVDETAISGEYRHKKNAEYLERALYVCPKCGLSTFKSEKDLITCQKCGVQVRHLPTKELEGVNTPFPFRFVADWYDYQCDFVRKLDLAAYEREPAFRDRASLTEVLLYQKKILLQENAEIALYSDRIEIGGHITCFFSKAEGCTVLGRNKLNIYYDGRVYQLKGGKRFNALKYVNFCYHYKNNSEGEDHGEFLGL